MSRPHAAACSLGLKGGAERLPTPRLRACPAGVRRNVALPPVSVRRHSSGLWEATLESTMGAMVVGARRCAHASRLCLVHTLGFPAPAMTSREADLHSDEFRRRQNDSLRYKQDKNIIGLVVFGVTKKPRDTILIANST
uniref:Uncharacterized protein n=1 Tax=Oryza meridionalis TaxID=40149 RepID=A0A0E0E0T8_9ORYZ